MGKQADDPDQGEKIKKVGMETGGGGFPSGVAGFLQLQVRHHDPVDVHAVHEKNPRSGGADSPRGPLGGLSEEHEEGYKEVTHHEENGVVEPGTSVAISKEPGLLGNIGVPLKEVLAEGDVSPEDREGKEEHSHDVIVFHGEETLEVTRANQSIGDQDQQGHGGLGGPGKEVDAPHGGVPVVIESHQPIKAGEGEAEHKKRNESIGGVAQAEGDSGIPIFILTDRKTAIQQASQGEEKRIN